MLKVSAIIEARSNSTRLPNKVLLKINKKTVLEHLVNKIKKSKNLNEIIIATTTNKIDEAIVKIAKKLKVKFFRGEENNVLKRVIDTSNFFKVDTIVRITSDCPLVDINLVDQYINIFNNNNVDLVGNAKVRSYPDGMDIEIINSKSLKKSYKFAKSNYLREHTCLTIYKKKNLFKVINIIALPNEFLPDLSLTLDVYKDFVLIKKIIKHCERIKKNLNCSEIIKLVHKYKWYKLNNKIKKLKHKIYTYTKA
jgi:spore coat polysaccharide biosynthesis protein SpsF